MPNVAAGLASALLVLAALALPGTVAVDPATTNLIGSATSAEGFMTIQTSVPSTLDPGQCIGNNPTLCPGTLPKTEVSSESACMAACTSEPGCNKCKTTYPIRKFVSC
jgi:hypothetical protein